MANLAFAPPAEDATKNAYAPTPRADEPRPPRYLSAASRGMDLSRNLFGSASAVLADAASTMRS